MLTNRITIRHIEEFAALVAALTKERIEFNGGHGEGGWWLEITGVEPEHAVHR